MTSPSNVMIGSASGGLGLSPVTVLPAAIRVRTVSCAMTGANFWKKALPPEWSPCACVSITNLNRLAREALHRHEQFVRDFRTTGVDQDDSVVAGGNRVVALIALQHADGAANRHDRESGVGICRAGGCHQANEK